LCYAVFVAGKSFASVTLSHGNEHTVLKQMRCGIYCRVSTDKQDTDNQLDQLRTFAQQQGWQMVEEFIETVNGSGKKVRPRFEASMLAASQRKFDVLLFWALDRLSREGVVKTIGYLEQLNKWGVGYRSYTQPYLDTGNDLTRDIVLAVLSAVAKQERVTISERTLAGLARARKAGKKIGRPRATGKVSRTTLWRRSKWQERTK